MPITVQYGSPGLLGRASYKTGKLSEIRRLDEIGAQNQYRQALSAYENNARESQMRLQAELQGQLSQAADQRRADAATLAYKRQRELTAEQNARQDLVLSTQLWDDFTKIGAEIDLSRTDSVSRQEASENERKMKVIMSDPTLSVGEKMGASKQLMHERTQIMLRAQKNVKPDIQQEFAKETLIQNGVTYSRDRSGAWRVVYDSNKNDIASAKSEATVLKMALTQAEKYNKELTAIQKRLQDRADEIVTNSAKRSEKYEGVTQIPFERALRQAKSEYYMATGKDPDAMTEAQPQDFMQQDAAPVQQPVQQPMQPMQQMENDVRMLSEQTGSPQQAEQLIRDFIALYQQNPDTFDSAVDRLPMDDESKAALYALVMKHANQS